MVALRRQLLRCRFCPQEIDEFTKMIGTNSRRLKRPAALLREKDVQM